MPSNKIEKYDYEANNKLCNYVRLKYQNELPNGALQIYLLGIPELEKKKHGFCNQFTANYEEIGRATCKNYTGLKNPLLALKNVLCEIEIGQPIQNGKKSTMIRRYTISELKENKRKSKIVNKEPLHAKRLSEILQNRCFVYGENPKCRPYWNIARTGRVLSNKPHVQGDSKKDRIKSLCMGLEDGQVLFDLDIKQAEPSIIQQTIGFEPQLDLYDLYSKSTGIDRNKAKPKVNTLAYGKSTAERILTHWPPKAQANFMEYAKKLDTYKAKLWECGKRSGKQLRFVNTLGGTRVYATRGHKNHRGKILCWHIQGTIADIINNASLEIIAKEHDEKWKYLFPIHDGFYVIGNVIQEEKLQNIIISKANEIGLELSINVKAIRKSKQ